MSFDEIGVLPKMMLVERNWQQTYGIEAELNPTTMSGFIHFCQSHDATGGIGNQKYIVLVTARESSWKLSSREESRSSFTFQISLSDTQFQIIIIIKPAK